MAGEAVRCSYVVLSVGRYLDPALAVRNLNPELPPPHTKSGVFFACDLAKSAAAARAVCTGLIASKLCSHKVSPTIAGWLNTVGAKLARDGIDAIHARTASPASRARARRPPFSYRVTRLPCPAVPSSAPARRRRLPGPCAWAPRTAGCSPHHPSPCEFPTAP